VQLETGQLGSYWLELAILTIIAFIAFIAFVTYFLALRALRWMETSLKVMFFCPRHSIQTRR